MFIIQMPEEKSIDDLEEELQKALKKRADAGIFKKNIKDRKIRRKRLKRAIKRAGRPDLTRFKIAAGRFGRDVARVTKVGARTAELVTRDIIRKNKERAARERLKEAVKKKAVKRRVKKRVVKKRVKKRVVKRRVKKAVKRRRKK